MPETTDVVIIGAGPAGLTLANLLQRNEISCVVLEARDRSYVEERQRAGVLDHYGGEIFAAAGLADAVIAGAPREKFLELRYAGEPHFFDGPAHAGGRAGVIVPQQLLVRRLLGTFVDGGGDLRFAAAGVALHDVTSKPRVTYAGGEIQAAYVAGCDGFHGVSRHSIPSTDYTFDHGIGWYTVLADAPPPRHALMGISEHGFAAQFGRGPTASRFYLEYRPGAEDPRDWPDDYAWQQLRLRLGDPALPGGTITDKEIVEMRSFVTEPMAYGNLFLAGDAAHIITPMGAKGMNLAVADADFLAKALIRALRGADEAALRSYSDTCLRRTWDYQEFSRWFTEMVHDAGARSDPFRRRLAKARFDRLFRNEAAAAYFADMMAGTASVE
ncbi:4-hydroxybenzoate 3-monooxygenase [Actinoplanes sp. NPDC026619]|uniref:4-hydroxybenzoate 3-monooxygenase n=1 Tax=Actinoplanes sp. NPDC026619 TaxID=3155798 RepID=UPI0033F2A2FF